MKVRKLEIQLRGDDRRVIARPFIVNTARVGAVMHRIEQLAEATVEKLLENLRRDFYQRHHETASIFEENYRVAAARIGWKDEWSLSRRHLAGAYFTMEYSVDSAALFNPSIVAHPDQSNAPRGGLKFIMSLRATGEGHVSSVVFRTGTINNKQCVELDPAATTLHRARIVPDRQYHKPTFRQKLNELGVLQSVIDIVLGKLNETFTIIDYNDVVEDTRPLMQNIAGSNEAVRTMSWLVSSNYHITLAADANLSELVIFPNSEGESHGIEDLRLVRFVEDDGQVFYYGTYTAYDGVRTLPMMICTRDFKRVEVHSLNGPGAANKGLALFPRRIGGRYIMCSRIDGENLYINTSDSAYFWESATRLATPRYPWEFMQIGNCGSPLETKEGWLLLTHGVGAMRSYAIGAVLLDLNDPLKVIGHLPEPLITPTDGDREGYVPNVVYSCGAIIHDNYLYVPYAQADKSTTMAAVSMDELLNRLLENRL
ncbi:MAG TPA: glycoside hydrolase family 130 protein [Tepidisphaeraceae bacterium]|nr:glycoside hydrolase family 130 protein [Tepidisphaeraceae bacterium]